MYRKIVIVASLIAVSFGGTLLGFGEPPESDNGSETRRFRSQSAREAFENSLLEAEKRAESIEQAQAQGDDQQMSQAETTELSDENDTPDDSVSSASDADPLASTEPLNDDLAEILPPATIAPTSAISSNMRSPSLNLNNVPTTPTLTLLTEMPVTSHTMTNQPTISDVYNNIPSDHRDVIILTFPEQDLVTLKPSVFIKGINRYSTPVYVNGNEITVQNDGRFLHNVTLESLGKQSLFISFLLPSNNVLNINRNILFVEAASQSDLAPKDREATTYFMNTRFGRFFLKTSSINHIITRAELASFIDQLQTHTPRTSSDQSPKDIADHWAKDAILRVVNHNIMTIFPDNTFKPNAPITRMEYIITLLRALDIPLDINAESPYTDTGNNWTAPFIATAAKESLIPRSSKRLRPNDDMSVLALTQWAPFIPEVRDAINELKTFPQMPIKNAAFDAHVAAIRPQIDQWVNRMQDVKKLQLISPNNNDVMFENRVTLTGKIFPAEEFTVNTIPIIPEINGNFNVTLPLRPGKNTITLDHGHVSENVTVYHFESPKDLDGHWAQRTVALSQYAGFIEKRTTFNPKAVVTRADLAVTLQAFFPKLSDVNDKDTTIAEKISDLPVTLNIRQAILASIDQGIMSISPDGTFSPDAVVPRAAAITAIVRAIDAKEATSNISKIDEDAFKSPYSDIPDNHWAFPYIRSALEKGLITSSTTFSPKRPITRAELIAILSREESVKQRLDGLTQDD